MITVPETLERRPLAGLIPYARNAKLHPEGQIKRLAASIREFGFTSPVLVRGDDILAGHGRVLAAQLLGMEEVPVLDLAHLSPTQAKAYILADNRLAESPWDYELLALELEELRDEDVNLDLLGFDAEEVDHLLAGWESDIEKAEGTEASGGALEGSVRINCPQEGVGALKTWLREMLGECPVEGARLA
jgi:ParB-like chromosome segregation protein Spo0J